MKTAFLITTLLLGLSSTQTIASEESCIQEKDKIIDKIKCLKSVTILAISDYSSTLKKIDMRYEQPMDHGNINGKKFGQRIVLLHRDQADPMILQTSGYSIFGVRPSHLARVFQTNQLQIEHRYFEESIPKNPDWSFLNIKQSADDFHEITKSFKKIYSKPWVNTGASKGGMTSIYHRYFYPRDVVGTVADVAPLSFSREDKRYNTFLENVGGDKYKECREAFKKMQIKVFENRDEFLPLILGQFNQLGSADVAFEHAMIESSFAFWQYGSPRSCQGTPANGTAKEAYEFLSRINSPDDYSDAQITRFMPYYYQAATQLGGPASLTSHLTNLIKYKLDLSLYTPRGVAIPYTNQAMLDVEEWALNQADEIMYVYGEFDPWTAAEFPVSINGKKTEKYYVSEGNHSANFTQLKGNAKVKALKTISSWLGKKPKANAKSFKHEISLEDIEFRARKKMGL